MTKPTNKAGELKRILIDFDQETFAYGEHQEQSRRARRKAIARIIKLFRECVPEKTDKGLGYSLFNSGRDSVIEEMNARIDKL
jgi:hypothetical protein